MPHILSHRIEGSARNLMKKKTVMVFPNIQLLLISFFSGINQKSFKLLEKCCYGDYTAAKERDPYLCAAGSFFLPGLGQVYCGKILRGIVFLVPEVLLVALGALIQYGVQFNCFGSTIAASLWALVSLITKIVDFAVRAVSTYDAYHVAMLNRGNT